MAAGLVSSCVLNSGQTMPMMGLGTWQTRSSDGDDVVFKAVDDALKSGYRMFDTASVYKNEADIGRCLKLLLPKYNLKRSDIFITSKLAPSDQGFDSAYKACLQSIDKLGCEYLDLYLIHWPATSKLKRDDPKNLEYRSQSWKAFEKLQCEGHAKSIGVSNYILRHLEEMKTYSSVVPAVNQVEFHPYLYQKSLMEYCRANNIILQAYSSLGIGKLVGDPVFVDMGKKYEKTSAHILYRWAIEHDIAILPKSTNTKHIKENIEVFSFSLTTEDMTKLDNLNKDTHFCWNPKEVA
ncbi:prostaglandin F synthase-like [Paramuricea clavata]|uniref:Prostaglandin F synthase-like n=1 Tax=Paramuricea clavata TaxID=317549 RepID=A0A6S7HMC5_PARCT|nr:prostaglandin F synthase-like [Paramuricea clavata]